MGSMIDYWGDLGANVGQGIANYSSASRLLEEQARTRKQQEEDRARQMALQNLQLHQAEAQEARRGGNFAGAAALYQSTLKDRNAFDDGARVGVKFEGTRTTQNSQRPTPDMQGPMPLPNAYDPSRPDWKNQKNIDLLDAGIGYQAPKEKVKVVPFGAGGLMVVTEHPDGQIETRIEREPTAASQRPLVLSEGQIAVEGGKVVAQGNPKTFAPPRASGGSTRRRTTTATIERDGKPVTVLIDSETGDIIKEVGVKPTTTKAPKVWTQQDENAALEGAKKQYPDDKMRGASPAVMDKRAEYVKQAKRNFERNQRKANGPDEFDKWINKKLGEK